MIDKKNYIFVIYFVIFFFFILTQFVTLNPYKFLSSIQDEVKLAYRNTIYGINNRIDIVLNNSSYVDSIASLEEENQRLNLLTTSSLNYINEILNFNKTQIIHPKIKKAKMISFVNIMHYDKLWIEFEDFDPSKIYGLVYDNYAIGIGTSKDDKAIALLNANKSCSYSVYIGKKKALGVMSGSTPNKKDTIIVNYIPPFEDIKVGDEVITSGLDKIFFRGIKVGTVKEIFLEQGYKKAIIEPYFKYNQLGYFLYAIDL